MAERVSQEIMTKNFPNLVIKKKTPINVHIQKAEWILNKINPKKSKLRHIIIKLLKTEDKEKNQKLPDRNGITYREHQFEWQQISQIPHLKPWRQEEVEHFSSVEKEKELSTMNFISDKTVLQE